MNNDFRSGGAAFPSPGTEQGMTLRDWFAGKALQSILHVTYGREGDADERAKAAYWQADAMLKARQA